MEEKNKKETSYDITPKGLATLAAIENGLLPEVEGGWDDSKFQAFWVDFNKGLAENGYSIFKICKN